MMYKVFFGIAFVLACFSSSSIFNAERVLGPGLLLGSMSGVGVSRARRGPPETGRSERRNLHKGCGRVLRGRACQRRKSNCSATVCSIVCFLNENVSLSTIFIVVD